MKYKKKPATIEAALYEGGGNFASNIVPDWVWDAFKDNMLKGTQGADPLMVKTLEGWVTLSPGSYLVKGVHGELYPCDPVIFAKTHEPVEEQDTEVAGGAVHKALSEEHKLLQDIVHDDAIPLLKHAIELGHLGGGSTLGWANNVLARLHTYTKLPLCTKCTHPIKGTKDLCYECLTSLQK